MEKQDYVFDVPTTFDETKCFLGIAVSLQKEADQFHCGLAFGMIGGQVNILHLTGHNGLRCSSQWGIFKVFVKPNIDIDRQIAFLPLCKLIINNIGKPGFEVKYGLRYDEYAEYDEHGILHLGEHEIGLTCATYVLTLFHSVGLDIVDIHNWPMRESDKEWLKKIFETYSDPDTKRHFCMTKEHLALMKAEDVTSRFRPEEVAVSSALFKGKAAPTEEIWKHGEMLNQYMYEKC